MKEMKALHPLVGIVQARLGSTRLPRKILKSVGGFSLLEIMLRRVTGSEFVDRWVLATTTDPQDDELVRSVEALCRELKIEIFRGSEADVLERYADAAKKFSARTVLRLTSDCPLMDPKVLDDLTHCYKEDPQCLYASNTIRRSFPRGLDAEIFSADLLFAADRKASDAFAREHVTPWIKEEAGVDRIQQLSHETNESSHRWTVDTLEDFELIEKMLLEALPKWGLMFSWEQMLELHRHHPEWRMINGHIEQKKN